MTIKPNDVRVVSVELLERGSSRELGMTAKKDRRAAAQELRDILAQPAGQQGEPFAFISTVTLAVAEDIREYQYGVGRIGARLDRNERHCIPLYRHAQPATAKVVLPGRETLRDVIAAVIGGDAYDCTRAWSAWGVGTMTDDDFLPIVEQEERLYELVDACLDEVANLNGGQS